MSGSYQQTHDVAHRATRLPYSPPTRAREHRTKPCGRCNNPFHSDACECRCHNAPPPT